MTRGVLDRNMRATSWADELTDQFDDPLLTEVGEILDRIESIEFEDESFFFREEIDTELKSAKNGLLNAMCLRLGERAIENCPPEKETEILNAATTLANPRMADSVEIARAKEKLVYYL